MVDPTEQEDGIRTFDLACGYDGHVVLSNINVHIPRGKVTCILGPSGCGKSTLMRTLLLLEEPIRGRIQFATKDVSTLNSEDLRALRSSLGVLFQGAALFNSMSLLENVSFPLKEMTNLDPELAEELALLKLNIVGLGRFAHWMPSEVSGGMRKRTGIARALALDPEWLFLDEPGAGLDPITSAEMDALVLEICETLGTTIAVVTHELASINVIADHLIMLDMGTVLTEGPTDQVKSQDHPTVRAFFDRVPNVDSTSHEEGGLSTRLLP